MEFLGVYSVNKAGKGLRISLPKTFTERWGIKNKTKLRAYINDKGELVFGINKIEEYEAQMTQTEMLQDIYFWIEGLYASSPQAGKKRAVIDLNFNVPKALEKKLPKNMIQSERDAVLSVVKIMMDTKAEGRKPLTKREINSMLGFNPTTLPKGLAKLIDLNVVDVDESDRAHRFTIKERLLR